VEAAAVHEELPPRSKRGPWRSRRKPTATAESEPAAVVAAEETEHGEAARHLEVPFAEITEATTSDVAAGAPGNHEPAGPGVEPGVQTEAYDAAAPIATEEQVEAGRTPLRSSCLTIPMPNGWPRLPWLPKAARWNTRFWKTKRQNFSLFRRPERDERSRRR